MVDGHMNEILEKAENIGSNRRSTNQNINLEIDDFDDENPNNQSFDLINESNMSSALKRDRKAAEKFLEESKIDHQQFFQVPKRGTKADAHNNLMKNLDTIDDFLDSNSKDDSDTDSERELDLKIQTHAELNKS